jgi:hypothetical protein
VYLHEGSLPGTGIVPCRTEWCTGPSSAQMPTGLCCRQNLFLAKMSKPSLRTIGLHNIGSSFSARTSTTKIGGHYVEGCLHYELPPTCWMIDPKTNHFVDIILEINASNVVGGTLNRESVVMIRNVMGIDAHDDRLDLLERLTQVCTEIRKLGAKGNARSDSKDVGAMFAIGTKIPYKKEGRYGGL